MWNMAVNYRVTRLRCVPCNYRPQCAVLYHVTIDLHVTIYGLATVKRDNLNVPVLAVIQTLIAAHIEKTTGTEPNVIIAYQQTSF